MAAQAAPPEERHYPQAAQLAWLGVHPQPLTQIQHPTQLGERVVDAGSPVSVCVLGSSGEEGDVLVRQADAAASAVCQVSQPCKEPGTSSHAAQAGVALLLTCATDSPRKPPHAPVTLTAPELMIAWHIEQVGKLASQRAQSFLQGRQLI